MSRLWSEHLCIALLPDCLSWSVLARGWGRKLRAQGSFPLAAKSEGLLWEAALEVLQRELPNLPIERGTVSVVVSNAFVRYLVVNSSAALNSEAERRALATHDLRKIYGVRVDGWEVRIAAGAQNYLAAAMDSEFLARLRHCFSPTRLKLRTVQPYAVAAINHWLKCFDGKTAQGLFMVEPAGYCYVGMEDGRWEFFQTGRWEGGLFDTCQHVIQREARRTGTESRSVWLAPTDDAAMNEELTSLQSLRLLPPDKTGATGVASVMALLGAD